MNFNFKHYEHLINDIDLYKSFLKQDFVTKPEAETPIVNNFVGGKSNLLTMFETKTEVLKNINEYWVNTIAIVRNLILIGVAILVGIVVLGISIKCCLKKKHDHGIIFNVNPSAPVQAIGNLTDIKSIPMLTLTSEKKWLKQTVKKKILIKHTN